jgi:hypothetical protein
LRFAKRQQWRLEFGVIGQLNKLVKSSGEVFGHEERLGRAICAAAAIIDEFVLQVKRCADQ